MRQASSLHGNFLENITASTALRWHALPLERLPDGSVRFAVENDADLEMIENLQALVNAPISTEIWTSAALQKAIEERYGLGAANLEEAADDAIVRVVDELIRRAHQMRATDIHIEPFDGELTIRFRVDGVLHAIPLPSMLKRFQPLLSSRIKILADMNIAEKRLPQDGRFCFNAEKEEIDVRVSTMPTIYGESLDLRLLPRTRLLLGLEELGMAADHCAFISDLIQKPNGILLVTGPTGHGKTTTLYACLSRINTSDKKIVTIEDPVEVRLRGVNQVQIHSKIGMTFAAGLRAVLRHDPDVLMVGEIRDRDTAEIAIRASLTGHLVFSTLHTNDAVGAITRLIDMGIEPYLVASSIHAVIAQRLIRLTCPTCKGSRPLECEDCRHTGTRGRTGIFEFFLINDEIRQLILDRASHRTIREKAISFGMRTLAQDGKTKVERGLTTLDEIRRVSEEAA